MSHGYMFFSIMRATICLAYTQREKERERRSLFDENDRIIKDKMKRLDKNKKIYEPNNFIFYLEFNMYQINYQMMLGYKINKIIPSKIIYNFFKTGFQT